MKYLTFLLFIALCYADIEFSARARNFSIELLHFTQKETEGHVVISPFGIWTLMSGVALGANGDSRTQLYNTFRLPKNENTLINGYGNLTKTVLTTSEQDVTLTSKNYVFLDEGFEIKNKFRTNLSKYFGAQIMKLDFKDSEKAADTANSIIGKKDGASVSNVLRSDDFREARMILTNVISFKGLWSSPFNVTDTQIEPFYDETKKEIGKVNMMYQRARFPFSNMQELQSHVVELPYGQDEKYSMLVILPYPKVTVAEVYRGLTTVTLKDIFNRLQSDINEFGEEDVDVKLPRFKISTNVVLNKPLNEMGVTKIFSPNDADFENITTEKIFISAIVHKADIEVTESGTVASADTSAYFADRISTPNFAANRPFIYFVMEKSTTTVIFSGIYSKPSVF